MTVEELLPDGTLHLFTDADLSKVGRVLVSQNSTHYGALYYADGERKTGRWIRNDNGTYSCSVCQSWIPEQQHCYARYCLYCGADMRTPTQVQLDEADDVMMKGAKNEL